MKRWPMYRLMEEPPEGGGDPGGGGGDPPEPITFSADVIPEEFRDRPAAEVKFLLQHMATGIGQRAQEVEDLRSQLADVKSKIPEVVVEPDPKDEIPLEELMLTDAPAAIERFLKETGYKKAIGSMDERLGNAEMRALEADLPGFKERKEDVVKILESGKLPQTENHIRAAYDIVRGREAITAEGIELREGITEPPSPAAPDVKEEAGTLTDLEREIMRAHGVTDEAEWIEARDKPIEVKVPT